MQETIDNLISFQAIYIMVQVMMAWDYEVQVQDLMLHGEFIDVFIGAIIDDFIFLPPTLRESGVNGGGIN